MLAEHHILILEGIGTQLWMAMPVHRIGMQARSAMTLGMLLIGSSSPIFPSSTNIITATAVMGFVTAASSKTLSVSTGDPVSTFAVPRSPIRTSFESPWQNGVAERWVESCRRDLLDHVVAVNERHLKRLLSEYARYYHEDRTHLGLRKGTPDDRIRATASGRVLSQDRLGGLHHRYDRAA
jgi:putative transposase